MAWPCRGTVPQAPPATAPGLTPPAFCCILEGGGDEAFFVAADTISLIRTDPDLLLRILGNMVKNALEATPKGGTVKIWHEQKDSMHGYCVHNHGVIPEKIALQIFQRSFTTKKEQGRGIGTYSMKLIGEKYLGGKVTFTSSEKEGTVFSFFFPSIQI